MVFIIGGGPAGLYAAHLLAKKGFEVTLFEEHQEIGKPIQCTGITTSSLKKYLPRLEQEKEKKEYFKNNSVESANINPVINKIFSAQVFSPHHQVEFNFHQPNLILNRHIFDNYLAQLAHQSGAKIFTCHRFLQIKDNHLLIKDFKNKKIKRFPFTSQTAVIGADGPNSKISSLINSKSNSQFNNTHLRPQFWSGAQVRLKLKNANQVKFYPFLGAMAWLVPENNDIARFGVLTRQNQSSYFLLQHLLKSHLLKSYLKHSSPSFPAEKKPKILGYQGGLVPIFQPKLKLQKDNLFLLGDAATLVKATTAGGIVQSLESARLLTKSLSQKKDFSTLIKPLKKELFLHLLARRTINKFSAQDWDNLLQLVNQKKTKNLLESFDRDHFSSFALRLLIHQPRFISFAKYLFPLPNLYHQSQENTGEQQSL